MYRINVISPQPTSFFLVENLNFYFRFSAGIRVCSMDNIR